MTKIPQNEPSGTVQFKTKLAALSQKIGQQIHSILGKCSPMAVKFWQGIEGIAAKAFALTDHSGLRNVRIMFRACIALTLCFFLWAGFFKIDQVIRAQGQIIASSRTQIVQVTDGGVLLEMKVHEGDKVEAGEVIAVLEKERAFAAFTESQGRVMALKMTISRLQAEISGANLTYDVFIQKGYPALYETQMNLYRQRVKAINDQLTVLQDNIRLAREELSMNLPLEKMGDISKSDILRLKRSLNEASSQYAGTKSKYLQDASA